MTFEVVFVHEPPIKGRRVCLTNIGGVASPEEAEAKLRAEFPGVVRVKRIHVPSRWHNRPEHRKKAVEAKAGAEGRSLPVTLPEGLTARILSGRREGGG